MIFQELLTTQLELEYLKEHILKILPAFGEQMKRSRKEKKITIRKMCESLGISIGFYCDLERGARKPSIELIRKIEKLLS
jgi:DNA-binding XRE family transcriptional regulator